MKKIILLTFLFFSLSLGVFADESTSSCKISQKESPELEKYFLDLRTTVANISIGLVEKDQSTGITKDAQSISLRLKKAFNLIIDWEGYWSYADFYTIYSAKNEYVPEVWRDYKKLEKESVGLEKYIKAAADKGYSNTVLPKDTICKNVQNCSLKDATALDILTTLYKNNEQMKHLYRLSILGKEKEFTKNLELVGDTTIFIKNFNLYYNQSTTNSCAEGNDASFIKKIGKSIQQSAQFQEQYDIGMKEWNKAIDLMNGYGSEKDKRENEERLLKQELKRQGISGKASAQIINNLRKYNEAGELTKENNFFANSIAYFQSNVKSQIDSFEEARRQFFGESKEGQGSYDSLIRANVGTKEVEAVKMRLQTQFNELNAGSASQDQATQQYIDKVIDMYINANIASTTLEETTKVAEKVCDDQKQGQGICTTN